MQGLWTRESIPILAGYGVWKIPFLIQIVDCLISKALSLPVISNKSGL